MNDLTVLIKAGYVSLPDTTVCIYHFLNQNGEKVIITHEEDYDKNTNWTITIAGSQHRGEEWLTKYCEEYDKEDEGIYGPSHGDVLPWLECFVFFGSKHGDSVIDFSTFSWAKGIAERRQDINDEIFADICRIIRIIPHFQGETK